MIVFDLRCSPGGHVFEAWFGSTGDYEDQQERGFVSCPICGSASIGKAVMAPRVSAKGNREVQQTGPSSGDMMLAEPDAAKQMLAAMAALQRRMLDQSTYVGERFSDEARAMHLGETSKRSIHGKATAREAESLAEEGIAVMPLPFPVTEPGQQN
jgi:hypothetical protein